METHSISAGLDYPGVGPEHAHFKDTGRAEYVCVTDTEAMDAFTDLSRMEGIIPALESAHAVAQAMKVRGWGGGRRGCWREFTCFSLFLYCRWPRACAPTSTSW